MGEITKYKTFMAAMIMTFAAVGGGGSCSAQTCGITTVDTPVFAKDIKKATVQLLDVREPDEYSAGHLPGAVNISVNSPDFVSAVESAFSKDKPVYVYCRSGRRSLKAAEMLAAKGFRMINLDGGILDWEDKSQPVVKQ